MKPYFMLAVAAVSLAACNTATTSVSNENAPDLVKVSNGVRFEMNCQTDVLGISGDKYDYKFIVDGEVTGHGNFTNTADQGFCTGIFESKYDIDWDNQRVTRKESANTTTNNSQSRSDGYSLGGSLQCISIGGNYTPSPYTGKYTCFSR